MIATALACLLISTSACPAHGAHSASRRHIIGSIPGTRSARAGKGTRGAAAGTSGAAATATGAAGGTAAPGGTIQTAGGSSAATSTSTPSGTPASGSTTVTGGFTISRASETATTPSTKRLAPRSTGLSHGAILAAILGGLLVLAALGWALLRFSAFEPHWLLTLRHSIAEAGFRTSATWAELLDWFRLGH